MVCMKNEHRYQTLIRKTASVNYQSMNALKYHQACLKIARLGMTDLELVRAVLGLIKGTITLKR